MAEKLSNLKKTCIVTKTAIMSTIKKIEDIFVSDTRNLAEL